MPPTAMLDSAKDQAPQVSTAVVQRGLLDEVKIGRVPERFILLHTKSLLSRLGLVVLLEHYGASCHSGLSTGRRGALAHPEGFGRGPNGHVGCSAWESRTATPDARRPDLKTTDRISSLL